MSKKTRGAELPFKKNDVIELNITAASFDGKGIGRYENTVVFTSGAVVGDRVKAHILKTAPSHAFAKAVEVIEPSPYRIEPECEAAGKCGGCAFRYMKYEKELEIKQRRVQDAVDRIAGIGITVDGTGSTYAVDGYRNKAQYPVGQAEGEYMIGFYAGHSHRIVNCRRCRLQPDFFADILNVVERWASENSVRAYDESTHSGLLRHIYIRFAEGTGQVMVCLVVNGNDIPAKKSLTNGLRELPVDIKSVMLNVNTARTNVILGEKCRLIWGEEYITDVLCGLKFRISPLSFYQVNRAGAEHLYEEAARLAGLTGSETLVDLYCGAGTIGLTMASRVKRLIGVEIVPQAVEDARFNASLNGVKNAEFICSDASDAAASLERDGLKPDVVIIDPPRKGCSGDVIDSIARMSPDRVVYVSCNPETMARDLAVFDEKGYSVSHVKPFDMFPRTANVETVALLSRKNG